MNRSVTCRRRASSAVHYEQTWRSFTPGRSIDTEATNEQGDDFGEERLIAVLNEYRNHAAAETLDAIIHKVQEFGGRDQADDMTLIVVRLVDRQPN